MLIPFPSYLSCVFSVCPLAVTPILLSWSGPEHLGCK